MPLFLRSISNLTRWDTDKDRSQLSIIDVSADTITDLRTTDNNLSVYQVEDDRSNLDRVITALAANRENLRHFSYLLFNSSIAQEFAITIEKTKGTTADDYVNENYHWDLKIPSVMKLQEIAAELLKRAEIKKVEPDILARYLDDASRTQRVKLSERLRKEVDKALMKAKSLGPTR